MVDFLAEREVDNSEFYFLSIGAISLIVGFGIMRLIGVLFDQLKDALFAKVAQNA